MIYFTSDWHVGHNKNFIYEPRGFLTPEDMDTAFILRTNEIVQPEDELYILGDLVMNNREDEWDRVFNSIECQHIHFLQGNHDTDNKMNIYEYRYKMEYHGYADIIKYSKRYTFYLSHYPTIVNNFDDNTTPHKLINLFGHTHQKDKFYNNNPYIYHVGVDSHNCYPVSIEQIILDIKQKECELNERQDN